MYLCGTYLCSFKYISYLLILSSLLLLFVTFVSFNFLCNSIGLMDNVTLLTNDQVDLVVLISLMDFMAMRALPLICIIIFP